MARSYPRFLFSDPKNVKNPGPFIVHTIFPRKIFKVNWNTTERGFFLYDLKEASEECDAKKSADCIRDAETWLEFQLKTKAIRKTSASNPSFTFKVKVPGNIKKFGKE
jgi:hypothetical protein